MVDGKRNKTKTKHEQDPISWERKVQPGFPDVKFER